MLSSGCRYVCVCVLVLVEVMDRNLAAVAFLDGKTLMLGLTLHHLMRGQALFDLPLDLHSQILTHHLQCVIRTAPHLLQMLRWRLTAL